ncbi:MAG: hypothetical protein EXR72_23255 [Myxococcales bacterium]|nr:hypothetical protein [Myxococcales bacterium]
MRRIGLWLVVAVAGCGGGSATDGGTADMAMAARDMAQAAGDMAVAAGDMAQPPGSDMASAPDLAMACPPPVFKEDLSACKPAMTDYQPRDNMSKNDTWPACNSDDNVFHPIDPNSVSTIARTKAFEDIAKKLWDAGKIPVAADFGDAKILYTQAEGIDSRVQRRQDIHYPELANGAKCSDMGLPAMFPDRCAGPAKLLPILNDAFVKGAMGDKPLTQAARIEAALLWFFYISPLSEIWSSTSSVKDIDSMVAYYGGGFTRDNPIGLGRYVKAIAPGTHDRVFDGLLAARCWRNLDMEMGTAVNLKQRGQAWAQVDKALLRGMALILRARLGELKCAMGDRKDAHFAFVQTIGPLMDRAARVIDPAKADALKAQVGAASADKVDTAAAQAALDGLFGCP